MKRVLIIDALNAYLRAYIVDPSISTNGQPIGGIKGFFKILQKLVRDMKPDEIVVVWDGPNGSHKRRSIDKKYKQGRKPIKLNRAFHNLSDQEEKINKIWQQGRVMQYLNNMPILQLVLPEIEADDVISYITKMPHYKGWQKVIVSNDKDFMQLCDDETVLFRSTKKEFLNKSRIIEQVGIHPNNMALARAIIGDNSDNLPGIPGAGFKTVAKRFNFLAEQESYKIQDVIDFCKNGDNKVKLFSKIIDGKDVIEHNYKMMQLYSPMMSVQSKIFVDDTMKQFSGGFNKTEIIRMMMEDGFGELNWESLEGNLRRIDFEYNK